MAKVSPNAPGVILMDSSGNEIPFIPGDITIQGAAATASPPTYVEGTNNPLSEDLTGNLRTRSMLDGSKLVVGDVLATPKFAKISLSATGAVVAAVGGKKIRVLGYVLTASAAVNTKFQSHVTPTDETGLLYLGTNTVIAAPFSPVGWFETISGEALDLNLSAGVPVGGHVVYVEV